jgi:Protein of unknown function (DUF1236)
MTSRFMMSVAAAALIAGTGFANAQGTMGKEAPSAAPAAAQPSAGPAAQQGAPAGRDAAEPTKPSSGMKATQSEPAKPASGMKATQSEEKAAPGGAKNLSAQEDIKAGAKPEKSAQDNNMNNNNMKGEKSKSMSSETTTAPSKDLKADSKTVADPKTSAESKPGMDSKSQTTTGQAAAGAKLSGEQRTKISAVIKQQNIRPAEHVNFSVSIGTRVPRDVGFHPLPVEIVTIYPDWRGYEMFLVGNQIVVVNPRTLEIVAVLDV